jgi:hypothetical protein
MRYQQTTSRSSQEFFPMVALLANIDHESEAVLTPEREALVARLTRAAYDVALRHTQGQPFTDLELALWRVLRAELQAEGYADQENT